ncbi:MAG: HAMP domain-containing sensor histidine kinase [Pseudomonadota bacterium]
MTMLPVRLIKSVDKSRLRRSLSLFFLALAVPTVILIWQAYGQLKWAAFHQHQTDAQELTSRIDARLSTLIETADSRSFADYGFLVVSGDPSANFVQRSPLSSFPVSPDVPGVLGYFQIDSEGSFSTPMLPSARTDASTLGIAPQEREARLIAARQLQAILADNQLVRFATTAEQDAERVERERRDGSAATPLPTRETATSAASARSPQSQTLSGQGYTQEVFDALSESRLGTTADQARQNKAGGQLDDDVSVASESQSVKQAVQQRLIASRRGKRTEQGALAEVVATDAPLNAEPFANIAGLASLKINAFESEIDPFEFSLLGSGHFVLFRRVWRDGERYIQGMLLDASQFSEDVIGNSFKDTALARMTNLDVLYRGTVIQAIAGNSNVNYTSASRGLDGSSLHRHRLIAPLNGMELLFSITTLPPGPGARVLLWITLALAVVFVVGFNMLYRAGLSQLALGQQQQDFVSAVSHELKSPLTSIRMYGEMLREGWVDDEKRQSYYAYIHDESERLSRLITNVLQLANIAKNEPQLNMQTCDVATLMRDAQSRIANQVERAGFSLVFNITDDAASVAIDIDPDCFVQIVINLVDNAIKFSKAASHKTIEVSAALTGDDRIRFAVRDYGPGVAKHRMKRIFEMFYRSESELTRETVGTGIGLAIVHQLTDIMGGRVDLVNVTPGAEFRFWFPARAADGTSSS